MGITAVLASIHTVPPLLSLLLGPLPGVHEPSYAPRELLAEPPQVHEASGEVMGFWRELREWRPQSGLAVPVSGLVLVRDAAEFHLDEGTLTLLDLRGRTAAAVFEGSGRVRIEPPLEVERKQLERYSDRPNRRWRSTDCSSSSPTAPSPSCRPRRASPQAPCPMPFGTRLGTR